jgi:hypothetical protein
MTLRIHARTGTATLLCLIATLSAVQTLGAVPTLVSVDNTMTVQLTRVPTSIEPLSASGTVLINLDNGQTKVELHHATPNATYAAVFDSTSMTSTVQLGNLLTDVNGEGETQTTLSMGAYAGTFSVAKLGIVQYTSNTAMFSINLNGTLSATISNSTSILNSTAIPNSTTTQTSSQTNETTKTNENQSTSSTTNTSQIIFQVQPPSSSINAGAFATFNIRIVQNRSANVFLVAQGVPSDSVAIFTPNAGTADPEFNSTLTIATSTDTPPGTYPITTVATIAGKEFTDQATLQILPPVSVATTLSNTTSASAATLSMTVDTDQAQYHPNMTVTVQGHVRDNTGNAVTGATITIQVDAPTGAQVFYTNNIQTDIAGSFQVQLTLPSNTPSGTFTVFSSATKSGYSSATTRSTFVVGTSSTPSVIIRAVYAGDSAGNPTATFTVGQTIWIWVVIQNIGDTFQGVVWIQVRDPSGVPVQIQIHVANLDAGATIKDGVGFTLANNAATGVYTVNALVSDKLISQGGTFLANADTQFALVG